MKKLSVLFFASLPAIITAQTYGHHYDNRSNIIIKDELNLISIDSLSNKETNSKSKIYRNSYYTPNIEYSNKVYVPKNNITYKPVLFIDKNTSEEFDGIIFVEFYYTNNIISNLLLNEYPNTRSYESIYHNIVWKEERFVRYFKGNEELEYNQVKNYYIVYK